MSNKTDVVNNGLNLTPIGSAVYQFAGVKAEQTTIARRILELVPNWVDGLESVVEEQIKRALLLRHRELPDGQAEYGYVEMNGSKHFVKVTPDMAKKPANIMRLNADIALSYTGQEWGAMKKECLEKYNAVGVWRKKGSKYVSNIKGDITREIKALTSPDDGSTTRSAPDDFAVWMKANFDKAEKRVKISKEVRGDTTADPSKLKSAIKAFWTAYKV